MRAIRGVASSERKKMEETFRSEAMRSLWMLVGMCLGKIMGGVRCEAPISVEFITEVVVLLHVSSRGSQ